MASVDEVQPVEMMWLKPRNPKRMEISLARVPMVEVGMVYTLHCFSMAGVIEAILLFGEFLRSSAGAHQNADGAQLVARSCGRDRCRRPRGLRGRPRRPAARSGRHEAGPSAAPRGFVKTGHFAGNLHLEAGGIEARNPAHAAPAGPVACQNASRPMPLGLTAPIPVIATRLVILVGGSPVPPGGLCLSPLASIGLM